MQPARTRVTGQRLITPPSPVCDAAAPSAAAPPATSATLQGCALSGPGRPAAALHERRLPPFRVRWLVRCEYGWPAPSQANATEDMMRFSVLVPLQITDDA